MYEQRLPPVFAFARDDCESMASRSGMLVVVAKRQAADRIIFEILP